MNLPKDYRIAGVHCGIKRSASKPDLALIVSDREAVAAGVYTQNLVFAAPVAWDRALTPASNIRAVVVNSGNANACTGQRGLSDAQEMARTAAVACDAAEKQCLVLSTGVIGSFLPMEKIRTGIREASENLGRSPETLRTAARGFLTTDSVEKLSSRDISLGGREVHILGIAKGAAMIGPKMATMLAVVLTDAALAPVDAQAALRNIVDVTFNCIHVDGHMSTNDTVLLLANGAAGGGALAGNDLQTFTAALQEVCTDLARAIPADGEGATHLITIDVSGCTSVAAARQIARTVADSPLVKTAIAGGDPNWGRIVSAAGYAGVEFDPAGVDLRINDFPLYERGRPIEFDAMKVSESIRNNRDTHVDLRFREGDAGVRFWTTDLTAEYVRLNADYHT